LFDLGRQALNSRQYAHAQELLEQSLEFARSVDDRRDSASALMELARLALAIGDEKRCLDLSGDALVLASELGEKEVLAACLGELAALLSNRAEGVQAARLLGAAQTLRGEVQHARNPGHRRLNELTLDRVREMIGEAVCVQALGEGRQLSPEIAVSLALDLAARLRVALSGPARRRNGSQHSGVTGRPGS
jgi:hypothetical protein